MEPIFDSHAHYDDEQFDPDRDALLNRIHKQGVNLDKHIILSRSEMTFYDFRNIFQSLCH